MNFEDFEYQAKAILQHQRNTKRFLSGCKIIADEYYMEWSIKYIPATKLKSEKATLKHLLALWELQHDFPAVDLDALTKAIKLTRFTLEVNEVLNTGGKASSLSIGDLFNLAYLKTLFKADFPNLKSNYKKDSVLHQLGEAFTGKLLPDKTDQLVNKALTNFFSNSVSPAKDAT